jgi:squalene-hopene/tetraprenyl-beta-curcumene cyclase
MLRLSRLHRSLLPVLLPVLLAGLVMPAATAADPAAIRAAIATGAKYLVEQGQAADGSFAAEAGPAVTALAVLALAKADRPEDAAAIEKGITYILSFRQPDGGIHGKESPVSNYETGLALLVLAAANKDGRFDAEIKDAQGYIRELQWDDGEGKGRADPAFGGAGYGKKGRPDLSNTQFMIEALKSVGASDTDPAIQKALVFVSRTQNLVGPDNDQPFPAKATGDDQKGGFYYTPAAGGESQAGQTPEGGLRSYGSMTYAGLKSMIYAGLKKDDPRVKAAVTWLGKHYTFKENPGMGQSGLFYYLHTAAKSLAVLGEDTFTDAAGKVHDWRSELSDVVIGKQRPDGSWINEDRRWMEDNPKLVTSYALLALVYCLPPQSK